LLGNFGASVAECELCPICKGFRRVVHAKNDHLFAGAEMSGSRHSRQRKPRHVIGGDEALRLLLDDTNDREFRRLGMLPPRVEIERVLAQKLARTTIKAEAISRRPRRAARECNGS
jgi:hypothetical protein